MAVSSVITPPVALASMAAAAIADSESYQTGFHAVKLGSWLFLMPVLFIYTPILLNSIPAEVVRCIITTFCTLTACAAAVEGYLRVKIRIRERILLFVSAFGLLHAGRITDIINVAVFLFVFTTQLWAHKRMAPMPQRHLQQRMIPPHPSSSEGLRSTQPVCDILLHSDGYNQT